MADDPFGLSVGVLPVTVQDFDQILLGDDRTTVAVTAARALPMAVIFQLLIRVRDEAGWNPNLAFDLPHLLTPGDLQVGVRAEEPAGSWIEFPVHVGGGGGGDGSFEFTMWFELPATAVSARLWSEWPQRGFPEQAVPLDLDAIRDAAGRCRQMWQ